jgi:hypothetical protein
MADEIGLVGLEKADTEKGELGTWRWEADDSSSKFHRVPKDGTRLKERRRRLTGFLVRAVSSVSQERALCAD